METRIRRSWIPCSFFTHFAKSCDGHGRQMILAIFVTPVQQCMDEVWQLILIYAFVVDLGWTWIRLCRPLITIYWYWLFSSPFFFKLSSLFVRCCDELGCGTWLCPKEFFVCPHCDESRSSMFSTSLFIDDVGRKDRWSSASVHRTSKSSSSSSKVSSQSEKIRAPPPACRTLTSGILGWRGKGQEINTKLTEYESIEKGRDECLWDGEANK